MELWGEERVEMGEFKEDFITLWFFLTNSLVTGPRRGNFVLVVTCNPQHGQQKCPCFVPSQNTLCWELFPPLMSWRVVAQLITSFGPLVSTQRPLCLALKGLSPSGIYFQNIPPIPPVACHLDALWELLGFSFVVRSKFKYNDLYSTCFQISNIFETGEVGVIGKVISDKTGFLSCYRVLLSNMLAICDYLNVNLVK